MSRRNLPLALGALLILVLLGCGMVGPSTPTGATATPAPPSPSPAPSAGPLRHPENLSAGDPYAPELGNAGYDVQRYTLTLTLDPDRFWIEGQVTASARSTMDGLDQISLDLVGLDVGAVTVGGAPASFFRQEDKLIVDLPAEVPAGTPFTWTVAYGGEPTQEASPYVPFVSHLGLHFQPGSLYVAAEPDGARYWFPVNDHPRDKATYRFELTVPAGLVGVANGMLVEKRLGVTQAFPDGRPGDRYIWEHNYPLASAFATVAVGDYRLIEGTSPRGVPLRHYTFPGQQEAFERATAQVGEMVDWMSDLLGPYPFEAFGYVLVEGLGASLETQSMVLLDQGMMDLEEPIAHELAHMWFGDWVSLDSWGDMWRSEGFTTYFSYLWMTRDDPSQLDQMMAEIGDMMSRYDSGYPLNNPPPDELFGRDSYLKGALLVHALRQEMGDEAFFGGLRAYFQRYGGGTATHAEFQAVMEEAAGISLADFFDSWFK